MFLSQFGLALFWTKILSEAKTEVVFLSKVAHFFGRHDSNSLPLREIFFAPDQLGPSN